MTDLINGAGPVGDYIAAARSEQRTKSLSLWKSILIEPSLLIMQGKNWYSNTYYPHWLAAGGFMGGFPGDAGDVGMQSGSWWGEMDVASGASARFGISGTTRDAYGVPLGSVVVKCYQASTDLLVGYTVSDALAGTFLVTTPFYPDAHYLVFYKVGSPDVFATTQNTLIAG